MMCRRMINTRRTPVATGININININRKKEKATRQQASFLRPTSKAATIAGKAWCLTAINRAEGSNRTSPAVDMVASRWCNGGVAEDVIVIGNHSSVRGYFQHAHFIPIVGVGKTGEY